MNIRKILSAGFVALALTASVGANATLTSSAQNVVRVDLSDLDLHSVEGKQVMQTRLKRAAREVCGSAEAKRAGSMEQARYQACFNESVANATREAQSRLLAAVK